MEHETALPPAEVNSHQTTTSKPAVVHHMSAQQMDDAAEARVVWGRVKGYPSWPVRVLAVS